MRITTSRDHVTAATEHLLAYDELVRPDDPHCFIRVVTNADDTDAAERMATLPADLLALGAEVSTGRVVDFRARGNLAAGPADGGFPLVYPGNLRAGLVEWPREIRKAQGFRLLDEADRRLLLPGGCYVVVKRFSAKEERRRIVAALWDPARNGHGPVAFENHLNVVHAGGRGLDRELAWACACG